MTLSKTLQLGAAVCALALGAAASASAATTITMDALYYSGTASPGATAQDYVNAWAAASAQTGYFNQAITDWNGNQHNSGLAGGANMNLAYNDEVTFSVSAAGDYSFRFGVDFGYGGTLVLDHDIAGSTPNTGNMWWAGNYANTSGVLSLTNVYLTAGTHVIDLYGFEDCCDGGTGGQYAGPNGVYRDFVAGAGPLPIPEPASWALMLVGLGLGGAVLRTRRQAIAAV